MEQIYWIWLARLEKVRNKIKQDLLEKYKSPQNIWDLEKNQFVQIQGITKEEIEELDNKKYREDLEKYIVFMNKNSIQSISIQQEAYPKKLKEIYDAPVALFVKGNYHLLHEFSIGMVGCRNCSQYGEKMAKTIANQLAKQSVIIVSGLAQGIDSHAHLGCLQANGKTIAVLGNGLDQAYPKENKKLQEQILEKEGLLVSEYVIGSKPIKQHFPARNRIISGLSNGLVIVEAREKSGSFITVDFALEQGKEVFAVPRGCKPCYFNRNK